MGWERWLDVYMTVFIFTSKTQCEILWSHNSCWFILYSKCHPCCCCWVTMSDSVIPWTVAHQSPLPFTISWSLHKFMSTGLVMLSNHLILCHALLLLPSMFPSIRVFSNESTLCIRWPKYWSFSISPSNEYSGHPWYLF